MSTHFATLGRCLSLLLLSASLVRAQSCYIANGVAATSDVVPCGDTSGGTAWSCCQLGDTCLEDSACYNTPSGVTYLYGCSDSSYSSSVCPYKCGFDSVYVGLTYCDTNGTSNLWTCTHPDSDTATQVIANSNSDRQECLADSYIAFSGPNPLPAVLNLPANEGGSTVYYSTYSYTSDGEVIPTYTPVDGYTPNPLPAPVAPASKPNSPQQVAPAPVTTTTPSTTPSTTPPRTTTSKKTTTPSLTIITPGAEPTSTSPTTTPFQTTSLSSTSSQASSSPSTTPFSSSKTQSSTFSTSSTSSSAATSSVAAGPSSSGLSTSAKAGIGGGVAGAAIAAAAVAFFIICLRRRRRSHEPVPQNEVPYTPSPYTPQTPYSPNSEKRYTDHPAGIPPVMGLGVAGGVAGGAMMAEAGSHPYDSRRSELPAEVPHRFSNNGSHSELDSYNRFASPTPTYSTWENTNSWSHSPTQGSYDPTSTGSRPPPMRPGHDAIHEMH